MPKMKYLGARPSGNGITFEHLQMFMRLVFSKGPSTKLTNCNMFIGTVGPPNKHNINIEKHIDLRFLSAKLNGNGIT